MPKSYIYKSRNILLLEEVSWIYADMLVAGFSAKIKIIILSHLIIKARKLCYTIWIKYFTMRSRGGSSQKV